MEKYKSEAEIFSRGKEVAENLLIEFPQLRGNTDSFLAVPVLQGGLPWSKVVLQHLADKKILFPTKPLVIQGRYDKGTSGKGQIQVIHGPQKKDLKDKNVIIFEDIIDEGYTLKGIISYLNEFVPAQIIISALCEKTTFRKVTPPQYNEKFIGFRYQGKKWFIGFGMDIDQKGRDYRHLYLVDPRP